MFITFPRRVLASAEVPVSRVDVEESEIDSRVNGRARLSSLLVKRCSDG